MKKKITLTIAFAISLLPVFLNQYGGCRGVQEISGTINLANPVGAFSVILFLIGVWVDFNESKFNKLLGFAGVAGIVVSEIYTFFTWHILTITGTLSLKSSISLAYPEFYIGLGVSIVMVVFYFIVEKICINR